MMNLLKKKGFTLVETVLAIGVVGVLLIVFVAMFYPARRVVQGALAIQESDRVVNALTSELKVVRVPERATPSAKQSAKKRYISAFDKAFYWMLATKNPETTILVYSYRGDLDKPLREDGTFVPYEDTNYIPGRNSVMVTTACLADDSNRIGDLKYSVGPIFAVKMTQFVTDSEGKYTKYALSPQPGTICNPHSFKTLISKPEDYMYNPSNKQTPSWGAEVMYHAEFYQLNTKDPKTLKGKTWEQLKNPIFSRNLVFRR